MDCRFDLHFYSISDIYIWSIYKIHSTLILHHTVFYAYKIKSGIRMWYRIIKKANTKLYLQHKKHLHFYLFYCPHSAFNVFNTYFMRILISCLLYNIPINNKQILLIRLFQFFGCLQQQKQWRRNPQQRVSACDFMFVYLPNICSVNRSA